ncbi:hypothetical protein SAMN04488544_2844 [Microlunatus sagamiharensis]|uniref:Uncharacterized protein n=1 Tax=Microlunatus sagamiharensis TaxID=546874 RepID=A0A1H2MWY2_9ACTN|nr:hypothetical protein [Microlunatus sagamiharensis]SDU97498.1 hypothetical protein SAMN04488544_2844 [Microlunatus sagamiharensis]
MSPRSAGLVPTPSALDGAQVLTRQSALAGDASPLVRDAALTVGAPGWTPGHHAAAQQRQAEALSGTIKLTPTVEPEAAASVVPAVAAPFALAQPTGAPTAEESAAVDALFDQAARINVVLLAFALVAVAAVLAVVLTHL